MKIVCPQCGFTREQKDTPLPSARVVAKCPRCGCRFRFSREKGVGEILPPKGWQPREGEEEEDIRVIASNAYMREADRFAREQEASSPEADQPRSKDAYRNPWADAPAPDGWATAMWQTILRVMFQAPLFFKKLNPAASMSRPLGFFLIICVFQTMVEWAWSQTMLNFLAQQVGDDPNLARLMELASPGGNVFLTLLIRSAILIFQLYVFSLLMYLAYRMIARDRTTFVLVFQVLAYSTAPWILCIIPAIGSIAGAIWGIGCAAAGCKAAMRLTWSQTAIGFLPIVFAMLPLLNQMPGLFAR